MALYIINLLSFFEVIFERVAEPFRKLHEFSLTLFQRLLAGRPGNESSNVVYGIQKFFYGTSDFSAKDSI